MITVDYDEGDVDEGDVEDVDLSTMPVGASQVRGRLNRRGGHQGLGGLPEEMKVFLEGGIFKC